MSIYITNRTGTPNIKLTKFENKKEAVKQPLLFGQKYDFHPRNTLTTCVYFDLNFSGITQLYTLKYYFKIIKVLLKKNGQNGRLCAFKGFKLLVATLAITS